MICTIIMVLLFVRTLVSKKMLRLGSEPRLLFQLHGPCRCTDICGRAPYNVCGNRESGTHILDLLNQSEELRGTHFHQIMEQPIYISTVPYRPSFRRVSLLTSASTSTRTACCFYFAHHTCVCSVMNLSPWLRVLQVVPTSGADHHVAIFTTMRPSR